jgi:copper chaperone CopZ
MYGIAKIPLILVILVVLISGCAVSGQKVQTTPIEQPQGEPAAEVRVYEVFGMDCPGCHGGIEKLVKFIPAVEKAEANWKKKQLVVTVKPGHKLDDQDVIKAIKEANFTPGKRKK